MNKLIEICKVIAKALNDRLEAHNDSRKAAQDKLHEICEGLRKQIDEFENKINHELEDNFNKEDSRLQDTLSNLRDVDMNKFNDNNEINKLQQAIQRAKAELLVMQSYDIIKSSNKRQEEDDDNEEEPAMKKVKTEAEAEVAIDLTKMWKFEVNNEIVSETLERRKPKDVHIINNNNNTKGNISVQFTLLNTDEERVLSESKLMNQIKYKCLLSKKGSDANDEQNCNEYPLNETNGCFTFTPDFLEAETTYEIRVKAVLCGKESEWSDETAEFTTPTFREYCGWKECPDYIKNTRKYSVDKKNSKFATMSNNICCCTITGNTSLPSNKVTSWSIKILKSEGNDGGGIFIGIAPFDINQNGDYNHNKCGWYFYYYNSLLYSGPPHSYRGKEYGPRKDEGQYVHTGDSVGVVMDTMKGELSFVVGGVNLGVAYEGIPLDKPLVPCVLLCNEDDSVELVV